MKHTPALCGDRLPRLRDWSRNGRRDGHDDRWHEEFVYPAVCSSVDALTRGFEHKAQDRRQRRETCAQISPRVATVRADLDPRVRSCEDDCRVHRIDCERLDRDRRESLSCPGPAIPPVNCLENSSGSPRVHRESLVRVYGDCRGRGGWQSVSEVHPGLAAVGRSGQAEGPRNVNPACTVRIDNDPAIGHRHERGPGEIERKRKTNPGGPTIGRTSDRFVCDPGRRGPVDCHRIGCVHCQPAEIDLVAERSFPGSTAISALQKPDGLCGIESPGVNRVVHNRCHKTPSRTWQFRPALCSLSPRGDEPRAVKAR
jgi:hypothetical protein